MRKLESKHAINSVNVTGKVNFLVCNYNSVDAEECIVTRNFQKALKIKIPIITESQFFSLLEGNVVTQPDLSHFIRSVTDESPALTPRNVVIPKETSQPPIITNEDSTPEKNARRRDRTSFNNAKTCFFY